MIHQASMIRRSVLMEIGGYLQDYAPAEDFDLFLHLGERGRLHNLPEILFKYRQHSASAGYDRSELQKRLGQLALEKAYQRRGLAMPPGVEIRGGPPPATRVDHHRKWAWWALGAGNIATARRHAFTAFRLAPFSLASWRTLFCAL